MAGSGDDLAGCLGCLGCLPVVAFLGLLLYGIAALVFRAAFGIELPNPFDWLPPGWQEYIPRG